MQYAYILISLPLVPDIETQIQVDKTGMRGYPPKMAVRTHDIAIAGSGPVGLTAALAARMTLGDRARIALISPEKTGPPGSLRTYALSHSSKALFDNLDVWSSLSRRVFPILGMDITDSELRDAVRQTFLQIGEVESGKPIAWMIFHHDLEQALDAAAKPKNIDFIRGEVESVLAAGANTIAQSSGGARIVTGLLLACDGTASPVREMTKIPTVAWSYARSAIVATVQSEIAHEGIATQHFLPEGTFALLPLDSNRFSIVWVEKPETAKHLIELPKPDFEAALTLRAGPAFGKFGLLDGPASFPLSLQLARRFVGRRLALLGDAAHTMHPLAGQGLNLGLRDVAHLMHAITSHARAGFDIGDSGMLGEYEQSRRFDTFQMLAVTDGLFRLFTDVSLPVRFFRDAGLAAIDHNPILKNILMRGAGGLSKSLPSLLRERKPMESSLA